MNRRGFLGSILALAAAPAIVRADSLMRVTPVEATAALDIADIYRQDFIAAWNERILKTIYERCNSALVVNREYEDRWMIVPKKTVDLIRGDPRLLMAGRVEWDGKRWNRRG